MNTERGTVTFYRNSKRVLLEDGRRPVCYGDTPEQAMQNAWIEFGVKAISATEVRPEITEYFAMGREVYAQYDDGTESFVLRAETPEHAEQKAIALNAKL